MKVMAPDYKIMKVTKLTTQTNSNVKSVLLAFETKPKRKEDIKENHKKN